MAEYAFDKHTRVELVSGDPKSDTELVYSLTITPEFNIGGAPNGGFLTAICVSALQDCLPHKNPCVTTTYFINRCVTGQVAQVIVSKIRITKRQSIAQARIVQNGEERVRVLANFMTFNKSNPDTTVRRQFPGNPIEECIKQEMDPKLLPNFKQMDMRMEESSCAVWRGGEDNSGIVAGYLRLCDGRETDVKALSYFADALYPTPFNMTELGKFYASWFPTLELTIQYFAAPAPGYVYVHNKCTEIVNGVVGIEGSLWDSEKKLVAISRQTALVTRMNIANNKL